MGGGQLQKASLWREGLRSFNRNWREWAFLGLLFFFILATIHGASFYALEPIQIRLQELKEQKDTHATTAYLLSQSPLLGSYVAALIVVTYIEHYLFFSFFMKKELPAEAVVPSILGFFPFLGVNILISLIVLFPALLIIVITGLWKGGMSPHLFMAGVTIALVYVICLGVRLYLALPLAAARIKAPMKSAWALSRDNFWRLTGNGLMIILVFLGIYLLILLASIVFGVVLGIIVAILGKGHMEEIKTVVHVLVRSVVGGGLGVYTAGVICAYGSVVCRTLYDEKKSTDSNFALTTRS